MPAQSGPMVFDRSLPGRMAVRRCLLCLLVLGVLLHGHAGALRQLLGAAHWHQPAAAQRHQAQAAPGGWAQLLAWRQQLVARSPLVAGHAPPGLHHGDGQAGPHHHHGARQRHHHAAQDSTVVALERQADAANPLADTLAGSLLQPLGLAGRALWAAAPMATPHWPDAARVAWRDAGSRLPDRPPRG